MKLTKTSHTNPTIKLEESDEDFKEESDKSKPTIIKMQLTKT